MSDLKQSVTAWVPPLAGVVLILLFVSLANWQLERAAEKEALAALFDAGTTTVPLENEPRPALYQPLTVSGRYLPGDQVLIDNIIRDGRVGYYVLTPFVSRDGRLLLVNRGWVSKERYGDALPPIDVGDELRTLEVRAGRLPRVALRPDAAFDDTESRPLVAVFPEFGDIERALGRDLDEPLLLLSPGEADGYLRDWQPRQSGATTHYGYAFQWSALALTVLVILVWQLRKRMRND